MSWANNMPAKDSQPDNRHIQDAVEIISHKASLTLKKVKLTSTTQAKID